MILTQAQIEKLLIKLGRIRLENAKLSEDINKILKYIDLLNEIDTSGVKPTTSVIEKENVLRDDTVLSNKIDPMELLKCSKQRIIGRQIVISNIMK